MPTTTSYKRGAVVLLPFPFSDLSGTKLRPAVVASTPSASEDFLEGCAGRILRRRRELGCDHIKVFGDVKKKHCSHALTGDLDILDEVKQAEFFLVDGVIVTGARTTEPPSVTELHRVKRHAHVPVLIGSGMTPENLPAYYPLADGFIVGSTFRQGGRFLGALEPERLEAFMKVFRRLRGRRSAGPG